MPVYDFSSGLGLLGQGIDSLNGAVQGFQRRKLGQDLLNNNWDAAASDAANLGDYNNALQFKQAGIGAKMLQNNGAPSLPQGVFGPISNGAAGGSTLPQANAGGAGGSLTTPTGAGGLSPFAPVAANYFMGNGIVKNPLGAAALAAGFQAESRYNPGVINKGDGSDGSDSINIGQWNGPRAVDFRNFYQANKLDPMNPETGLAFSKYELQNKPEYAGIIPALEAAKTPEEAQAAAIGYWAPKGYRPNNPTAAVDYPRRVGLTRAVYASLGQNPGAAAGGAGPANPGPVQTSAIPPVSQQPAANVTNQPQQPQQAASPQPVQNPVPGSTQSGGGYLSPQQQASLGLPQTPVRQVGPVVQQPPTLASNQGVGYISPPGYASQLGIGYPGTVAGGASLGPSTYGAGSIGGANMGGAGFSTAFGGPIPGISNSQAAFAGPGQLSPIQTGSAAVPGGVPSPQAGATPAALPPAAPRPTAPPPATPAAAPAAAPPAAPLVAQGDDPPVTINGKQWTRAQASADDSPNSASVKDVAKAQGYDVSEADNDISAEEFASGIKDGTFTRAGGAGGGDGSTTPAIKPNTLPNQSPQPNAPSPAQVGAGIKTAVEQLPLGDPRRVQFLQQRLAQLQQYSAIPVYGQYWKPLAEQVANQLKLEEEVLTKQATNDKLADYNNYKADFLARGGKPKDLMSYNDYFTQKDVKHYDDLTDPELRAQAGYGPLPGNLPTTPTRENGQPWPAPDATKLQRDSQNQIVAVKGQQPGTVIYNGAQNKIQGHVLDALDQSYKGLTGPIGGMQRLTTLNRMQTDMNNGIISGYGPAQNAAEAAATLLSKLGIGDVNKLGNTQAFVADGLQEVMGAGKSTFPQRITNADIALLKQSNGADPALTQQALQHIIDTLRDQTMTGIAEHKDLLERYATEFPDEAKSARGIYTIKPSQIPAPVLPTVKDANGNQIPYARTQQEYDTLPEGPYTDDGHTLRMKGNGQLQDQGNK